MVCAKAAYVMRGAALPAGSDMAQVPSQAKINIVITGVVLLAVLCIVVVTYAYFLIEYSINNIVLTLAAIESPTRHRSADEKDVSKVELEALMDDQAGETVDAKPITAGVDSTLNHLWKVGGRWAIFRGFAAFLVKAAASAFLAGALVRVMPVPLALGTATLLVAPLDLTWKTIIMTVPNQKYWFQRLPSWAALRKTLPAYALDMVASQLVVFLPLRLLAATTRTMRASGDYSQWFKPEHAHRLACAAVAPLLLMAVLYVLVQIPARVTLNRTQASVLPDSEETIVPFDRSFGGRFVAVKDGGSGVIGLLDAWRSFPWSSRLRVILLHAQLLAARALLIVVVVPVIMPVASDSAS